MSSSESVPSVVPATQALRQHFNFGVVQRLDKIGFADILTPTKAIRVASLARRGFVKATLAQSQFLLRLPLETASPSLSTPVTQNTQAGRMGAVAPKRLLKRAVLRNRAKRIMREASRQHPLMAEPVDFIVFLREKAPLKNKAGRKLYAQDVAVLLDRTFEQVIKVKKRAQLNNLNAKPPQ